jgi:23S rRNA (cytosine1962-C5)-methyltransferase
VISGPGPGTGRARVTLTPKGVERARSGHPWIYRTDIADVRAVGGDLVEVVGPRGRPLGTAFFSDRSQIALRLLARAEDGVRPDVVPDLLKERLARAIAYRNTLAPDATAFRLVHAEGDLLPSLIVDQYGDCLVVQTLSQATDRLLPEIVAALVERCSPAGIVARNDAKVRELEGLPTRVDVVHGTVPEQIVVREGKISYGVELFHGQKTGLFLDQRENREAAARYAHGRLLDAFSYNGGFALTLADRCSDLMAIEISAEACARIKANARRNGVDRLEVKEANVFDELRELDRAGARFDTIVLDPPAFAKNRASISKALAGYKEINLRALRLLRPGGILVTCTCSYHVDEWIFEEVVRSAGHDAGAAVAIVEKRTQGRDHPILLGVPETLYLKCLILRKL